MSHSQLAPFYDIKKGFAQNGDGPGAMFRGVSLLATMAKTHASDSCAQVIGITRETFENGVWLGCYVLMLPFFYARKCL